MDINKCYNMDCMEGMRIMKEEGLMADWCITDPPYGINNAQAQGGAKYDKIKSHSKFQAHYKAADWDKERISKDTFDLIHTVSKEQIIFGGNYYTDYLAPTKSWVIWDKREDNHVHNDYPDAELAWASTGRPRVIRYMYNGFAQENKIYNYRFHPTQKPVVMWQMLLNMYTKENDLILDPFAGSQSLHIACLKMDRLYIGFEKDPEYVRLGNEWVKDISAQLSLF